MSQPQPDAGNGNEGIGAPQAQTPEARLTRGPAFVPLARTPRASEFGMEPEPDSDSAPRSESEPSEADGGDAASPPKSRKPSLFARFRLRKRSQATPMDSRDDDSDGDGDDAIDHALDHDPEDVDDGDPDAEPTRRPRRSILSGRRLRVAIAVGLSLVVLGGALTYPKLFPGRTTTARTETDEESDDPSAEPSAESAEPRGEARSPVVAAIPSGRDSRPSPAAPDDPSILPDPSTVVPTPSRSGVRLTSADQPAPLDEPAPMPAAGVASATGDEPTPLPADALAPPSPAPGGPDVAQNQPSGGAPPLVDNSTPGELPPPVEVPPALPAADPAPAPAPAAIQEPAPAPPSLVENPAPAPAPAPASTSVPRTPGGFTPPPLATPPVAVVAPAPVPAAPADPSHFVSIPNTRRHKGGSSASGSGSMEMVAMNDGPSSRVGAAMDQPPSAMEPAVPQSVDPILHRVGSGQNFQTISKYYYGTTRYWKALWSANRAVVPAPELLAVGMTIKIPMADELESGYVGSEPPVAETVSEPLTIRSTPRNGRIQPSRFDPSNDPPRRVGKPTYTVRRNGETLRSVARDVLGDTARAREIQELNAERLDGSTSPVLRVGMTLRLPDDARPDQP